MKKEFVFLFSSLVFMLSIPSNVRSQDHKILLTDNPLKNHLDSAIQIASSAYLANPGTVGLSIALYKDGQKFMYNYGESKKGSGQLISANQLFNLGSIAKTFAGILLAEAVVQKKAKLSDDIRKYLPGKYPNLQDNGRPVRLVHIANHTSGLPKSSRTFPAKVMDSLKNLPLPGQLNFFNTFNQDSLLKDMHHFKLNAIPGNKYDYNGNAITILILLLERIYHQPYEKLVTDYLRNHHRMNDTRTKIPVAQLDRFVQGYKDASRPVQWYDLTNYPGREINTNFFYPGGPGMNSTMSDMLKYVVANVEEKDPAIKLAHQQTFVRPDGTGLGLTWMFGENDGKRFYFHSGKTGIGFSTLCSVYPEQGIGMMILVNDTINQDLVSDLRDQIKAAMR